MRVWSHRQESISSIIALKVVAPISPGVLVLLDKAGPAVPILRRTHEAQLLVKWEGLRVRRSRTKLSELRNARIVI
jgi:hypothetical protein